MVNQIGCSTTLAVGAAFLPKSKLSQGVFVFAPFLFASGQDFYEIILRDCQPQPSFGKWRRELVQNNQQEKREMVRNQFHVKQELTSWVPDQVFP